MDFFEKEVMSKCPILLIEGTKKQIKDLRLKNSEKRFEY
jgi:hypothetical protein